MQKVDQLFDSYSQSRDHNLTKEQFVSVISMVPALLVANSDGVLDTKEMMLVGKLSAMLGDEFIPDDVENVDEKEKEMMNAIKAELQHILRNASSLENDILDALKEHGASNPKSKEFMEHAMHLFAGASGGYSSDEEKKMDELYDRLGL